MNLTELNASLNRQKGGFDRWAHSRLNAVESIRQKHQVDMKKASEEYEELKENHEKLLAEVEKLDASIKEENTEARALLQELEEKQRNAQLLPEEVSRLTEEVSLKADLVRQREQEQRDRHAKREEKLSSFQSLARLYGEKLGMHFVHTPSDGSAEENALRIGFTQIDRRSPDRKFWFDVRIAGDDTYSVLRVSPEVAGVAELEKDLNEDQDFSRFVRRMRKKFKDSV